MWQPTFGKQLVRKDRKVIPVQRPWVTWAKCELRINDREKEHLRRVEQASTKSDEPKGPRRSRAQRKAGPAGA